MCHTTTWKLTVLSDEVSSDNLSSFSLFLFFYKKLSKWASIGYCLMFKILRCSIFLTRPYFSSVNSLITSDLKLFLCAVDQYFSPFSHQFSLLLLVFSLFKHFSPYIFCFSFISAICDDLQLCMTINISCQLFAGFSSSSDCRFLSLYHTGVPFSANFSFLYLAFANDASCNCSSDRID